MILMLRVKVCRTMASRAILKGFGLLVYLLFGFQVVVFEVHTMSFIQLRPSKANTAITMRGGILVSLAY